MTAQMIPAAISSAHVTHLEFGNANLNSSNIYRAKPVISKAMVAGIAPKNAAIATPIASIPATNNSPHLPSRMPVMMAIPIPAIQNNIPAMKATTKPPPAAASVVKKPPIVEVSQVPIPAQNDKLVTAPHPAINAPAK